MENQKNSGTAARAPSVGRGTEASKIVAAIVSTWQEIDAALSPIIGRGGVAALYKRSLSLVGSAYPWFAGLHKDVQTPLDLTALKSVLSQQSSATAAAGGDALLQTFCSLVTSLVGPSLAEKILGFACSSSFGGSSAQDTCHEH
jgi:hypothetical protein